MDVLNIFGFNEHDSDSRRSAKIYKERINFEDDNSDFVQRFRLSPSTMDHVLNAVKHKIKHVTKRSCSLSSKEQLLTCLRFLATNGFYHLIRDAHGPSESSVCRAVKSVVKAINEVYFDDIVQWPRNSIDFARQFKNHGGMPCVGGLVDGTHVNITRPSDNEVAFVNRHGKHSLNVMLVCGPQYQFVYCNASWPGSVNDARILRNSTLYERFQGGYRPFHGAVLLGDSIYPLTNWLITTVNGNVTGAAARFNKAHCKTRSVIERSIGILKLRFPCLNHLRVKTPVYAAEVVKACVCLHNICMAMEPPNLITSLIDALPTCYNIDASMVDEAYDVPIFDLGNSRRRHDLIQYFN